MLPPPFPAPPCLGGFVQAGGCCRAGRARAKMAAKGPLSHVKLEGEIERCRAEGHWGQLRLLVQQQLLPPARTRRKVAAGGTEETGKLPCSAGRSPAAAGREGRSVRGSLCPARRRAVLKPSGSEPVVL